MKHLYNWILFESDNLSGFRGGEKEGDGLSGFRGNIPNEDEIIPSESHSRSKDIFTKLKDLETLKSNAEQSGDIDMANQIDSEISSIKSQISNFINFVKNRK